MRCAGRPTRGHGGGGGRFATARRDLHSEDVRYDDVNSVSPEQPWRQDSESVLCARKRPVKPSDVAGRRILREEKTGSFSGRGAWDTGSCWRRDVGGPPLPQKSLISKSSDSTLRSCHGSSRCPLPARRKGRKDARAMTIEHTIIKTKVGVLGLSEAAG